MTTRIMNFFKTIRNNWKKSVVGSAALTYGVSYSVDLYEIEQLMREYCEEAAKYGEVPLPVKLKPRHVTVVLNPASKKRKSKKLFEEYCEPLLHLAGIAVTVIQTKSENHARELIKDLNTHTDAIVVAGGDGTLSDVVTGLMRKYESNRFLAKHCPIGILPLGQTNRIADSLFHKSKKFQQVQQLADATMAVVRENTRAMDVIEVEPLDNESDGSRKSIYAVGALEWGAWADAHYRADKYWYWGPLRRYVTYIFNGYKDDLNWNCVGTMRYTDPCEGCSQCYQKHHSIPVEKNSSRRWWEAFVPKTRNETTIDYRGIKNENCNKIKEMEISATELQLFTNNVKPNFTPSMPSIKIELGPDVTNYSNFVTEGWKRAKGGKSEAEKIEEAKEVELHINQSENKDKERMFYIDNEEFELKSMKIKLLPRSVTMFCPTTIK